MFLHRLSTLSIWRIKSDKLRQTNFEFLDDFVMKARTKPFQLFTMLYSALLTSTIVAFYFLSFLVITAWRKFKPHILSRDGFVAIDSLQFEKVTNTRIVILAVAIIWVDFLDVFCSCVRDFYSRGPHGRHTYV